MKKKIGYTKTMEYENKECWKLFTDNNFKLDTWLSAIMHAHKSKSGKFWYVETLIPLESIVRACDDTIELVPQEQMPAAEKKSGKQLIVFVKKSLPVIIPLSIAAVIILAIFFFDTVIKTFFTVIMAGALAAPVIVAIRDKKQLFSWAKLWTIVVSGAVAFLIGIWGFINIADILHPIVCPPGFERVVNKIDSYGTDDGESFEMNYFTVGELGTYQLDSWNIFLVGICTFVVYSISVQFIGYGVNRLVLKFRLKNKYLNMTAPVAMHLSALLLFLSLINLAAAKDTLVTRPLLKVFNNILYPGQMLSIIEATRKNKSDIIDTLIIEGADFLAKNENGESALFIAQTLQNKQLIAKFREKLETRAPGVIPLIDAGYFYSDNSFLTQIKQNNTRAVNLYLDAGFTAAPSSNSHYPLYTAVVNNRKELAKLLIAHGAPVNNTDQVSLPPLLLYAANTGLTDIAITLIQSGADTSVRDNEGNTVLHLAGLAGNTALVSFLLDAKIEIDAKNSKGETPFLTACKYIYKGNDATKNNRYFKIAEMLGNKKADLNIQNNDGWAPIMYAAMYYHVPLLEYLFSKEVNVNARLYIPDSRGTTALLMAQKKNFTQIVSMLKRAGAVE
ncbi:MAG: ankyrin repeat domain-containing protein [Spirochaetales bacterium]|nr:ankyrin repeat domain-containing protein [Spirochaetales bacterium]